MLDDVTAAEASLAAGGVSPFPQQVAVVVESVERVLKPPCAKESANFFIYWVDRPQVFAALAIVTRCYGTGCQYDSSVLQHIIEGPIIQAFCHVVLEKFFCLRI